MITLLLENKFMKKLILTSLLATSCFLANNVMADQELDVCIKNVQAQQAGYILKLEKLKFSGKSVYEFEIADPKQGEWELLCEAKTGKIIEQESEAYDPNVPAFKKNVKITEEAAAKIALKTAPGKIREVEYEIENNGSSSYEFDILSNKGLETKVEVDAATGKVMETAVEDWQVGEEKEETR
jgi:uncharacterized membrane protein YkoI